MSFPVLRKFRKSVANGDKVANFFAGLLTSLIIMITTVIIHLFISRIASVSFLGVAVFRSSILLNSESPFITAKGKIFGEFLGMIIPSVFYFIVVYFLSKSVELGVGAVAGCSMAGWSLYLVRDNGEEIKFWWADFIRRSSFVLVMLVPLQIGVLHAAWVAQLEWAIRGVWYPAYIFATFAVFQLFVFGPMWIAYYISIRLERKKTAVR